MLRCQSLDWTRTECALWICIAFAGPAAPRTVAPTSGCLLPLSVAVLLSFLRCANIAPSCLLFSSSFPAQSPQRHPHAAAALAPVTQTSGRSCVSLLKMNLQPSLPVLCLTVSLFLPNCLLLHLLRPYATSQCTTTQCQIIPCPSASASVSFY